MPYTSLRDQNRKQALVQSLRNKNDYAANPFGALAQVLNGYTAGRTSNQLSDIEAENQSIEQQEMADILARSTPGYDDSKLSPIQSNKMVDALRNAPDDRLVDTINPAVPAYQSPLAQQLSTKAQLDANLAKQKLNSTTPSNIQEWQAYQGMSPEQREQYLTMKRANPWQNMGGQMTRFEQTTNQPVASFDKTLAPADMPENAANKARAVETAQQDAEIAAIPEKTAAEIAADKEKKIAEVQVEAQLDLPKIEYETNNAIGLIDKLLEHPGTAAYTGKSGLLVPDGGWPGGDTAASAAILDQIKGQQFMKAYETLKGGGVITEIEGEKATQALARMQRRQSDEDFKQAAKDYQDVLRAGMSRLKERAKQDDGWTDL